jgi:glycosyltransferase involved in cell wall biosynthesis
VILPYFDRPKMVQNALRSLEQSTYPHWELAFIDDGSTKPLEYSLPFGTWYYQTGDSVDYKLANGSRHGAFMNRARQESDADLVVILCDDDALVPDYLENLNRWFNENPQYVWCYSHVRIFNPFTESPNESVGKREYFTNVTGMISPSCRVDSSQVAYRRITAVPYRENQTSNLDATFFADMFNSYGECPFTGFDSQYKGIFPDQLGNRANPFQVIDLP